MARRSSTRGRRVSRFTPRRWLPVIVLTVLVAAAIVVPNDERGGTVTIAEAERAAGSVLPTVATEGALSTAWFCSGGTARGLTGPAELTLVLANVATRGARAEITVYDDKGGERSQSIDVPANGRTRVVAESVHSGAWVAATVDVQGGRVAVDREVRGALGFDAAPCATDAGQRWFVASGSTLRGADEHLVVFNPFPDDASVDIGIATETGERQPKALQGLSVPGRSLRVVRVGDTVTARSRIAGTISARAGRVVVDRVQTWDGTGDKVRGAGDGAVSTPAPKGLVSTPAVPAAAARWFFPGGTLTPGGRSQVGVYNPSSRTASVDVVLAYERPATNAPIEPIQLTVPARSQVVADLTDDTELLPDVAFTIDVRSLEGIPVVAERTAFTGAPTRQRGVGAVVGSPVAATRWLLTQGGPSRARSSGVVVANPGPRSAKVAVVEVGGGSRRNVPSAAVTVPAGDRRVLELSDAAPAATLDLRSTGAVVVAYRLSLAEGFGVALASAEPFPETLEALAPTR